MKNSIPPSDIIEQTENDSNSSTNVNADLSIQENNSTNSNNTIF
jgi:hypothetical protein